MSAPKRTPEQLEELLALAAVGALSAEEAAEFRREADSETLKRLREVERTAGLLGLAAPAAEPPEDLKDRLFDRIAAEPPGGSKRGRFELEGLVILRSADLDWKPAFPGGRTKILNVDKSTGIVTQLLKLEAGATIPGHRHAGEEEVLLLEGDLLVHGVPMQPGDYCRADPQSVHQPARTEGGATLLIRTSAHNEYFA